MVEKRERYFLVLDLGTTNAKSLVFDDHENIVAEAAVPIRKNISGRHRVEQDPLELLAAARRVVREAYKKSGLRPRQIISFGLTTQRETTILWDRDRGQPIYPAIVWEDARSAAWCGRLSTKYEESARQKTGLSINSYFSASKIHWILAHVSKARALARQGRLLFGTPDTWLLWNFTENHQHLSDYTNACRTLLFNIKTLRWDNELLNIFGVPKNILPEVRLSRSDFGHLKKDVLDFSLPIRAVVGDQQASLYAAGTGRGTTKVTHGTGLFAMQIIGRGFSLVPGFFTTLAIGAAGQKLYAIEAKANIGARQVTPLLRQSEKLHAMIIRIAHEAGGLIKSFPYHPKRVIIDGGISRYEDLAAIESDIFKSPVVRQSTPNGTALGVARLLAAGS